MKVGIITYHFPYNCGAALQCLALQTKLEELGHEVCVINYRPWYHQNRYTALKNPVYFAMKQFFGPAENTKDRIYITLAGFFATIRSWKNYPKLRGKDGKCHRFVRRYLKETRVYRTVKQLQKNPPNCDIYIAGSDQLWNATITEGKLDSAYFLNFGGKNVGRMTYSVGANFSKLANPEAALKELIRDLDVISLRESQFLPVVEAAAEGKIPTHIDLDPTMLLEPEKYERFMPNMPEEKEPYILTYTMPGEPQKQIYNGARILSEKLGIKVIDVSANPGKMNEKVEDHRLCSPDEFLWYVKYADYVFTNSFHGTVFSVLFRKKFMTIPHAQTGNRVTELLDKLGLSGRYHTVTTEAVKLLTNDIDYYATFEKLQTLRDVSLDFLQSSIQKYSRKGE